MYKIKKGAASMIQFSLHQKANSFIYTVSAMYEHGILNSQDSIQDCTDGSQDH